MERLIDELRKVGLSDNMLCYIRDSKEYPICDTNIDDSQYKSYENAMETVTDFVYKSE